MKDISPSGAERAARPRAREVGVVIGTMSTGSLNSITDVPGVRVGHVTLRSGTTLHTGVTAILPHSGNLYQDKVPAGFATGNGFGKFAGSTQVEELGEIETPILLTNTLSVPEVSAGIIQMTLAHPANAEVLSVNPVVGETNDGLLNDIRARAVQPAHAMEAIRAASDSIIAEGAVGAGAGTIAFGFKGGIGTSSRQVNGSFGTYTVGVLVQSNYGGTLTIAGVPLGPDLETPQIAANWRRPIDGSVVVVIATNAPLSDRNLRRLAVRAFLGLGRTGSCMANGSGDYAIAFSTALEVRRTITRRSTCSTFPELPNEALTAFFAAVTEATEEAVVNSLFKATTTIGCCGIVRELPLDVVIPRLVAARRR